MRKYVKLTKSINRTVGTKKYYKHIVTIPNGVLDELQWTDKTDLNMRVSGTKLVIEKK